MKKFKNLTACVLDIKEVINATNKIIKREGFTKKINTCIGDMTKKLPEGFDVIMYCDTDNLSPEGIKLAYDALPSKGLFVLVDYLSSEDLTEPFIRLMWQLRSPKFWLVSRKQAVDMIRKAGFKGVKISNLYQDSWLITGRKV